MNDPNGVPCERCNPYGSYISPVQYNDYQGQQSLNPMTPVQPPINPVTPLSPVIPSTPSAPIYPPMQQGPPPVTEYQYIPGYLASNIGRNIKAEFIIGTSNYVEKVGRLVEVGVNYFVIADVNSRTNIMCDLYSVRFVTVLLI